MQTRQWHPFLVLVVGLPLKLHSSQGLFFPRTAILMLRERFLIAENTCKKNFPRFARTDQRFAPLRYEYAVPLLLCRCRPCIVITNAFHSMCPAPQFTSKKRRFAAWNIVGIVGVGILSRGRGGGGHNWGLITSVSVGVVAVDGPKTDI